MTPRILASLRIISSLQLGRVGEYIRARAAERVVTTGWVLTSITSNTVCSAV